MKLTLPIEVGKKYLLRYGEAVLITGIVGNIASYHGGACYAANGKAGSTRVHPLDLIYDYVEPVSAGHIHAASMALYAQDAAETDEPWKRWEYRAKQNEKWLANFEESPYWITAFEYRRKPKFIDINGHQVPEPMRVAPKERDKCWVAGLLHGGSSSDVNWRDSPLYLTWLDGGLCHTTKEAADFHGAALISFTKSMT